MISCNKCGIGNRDDAKFCSSCGVSISDSNSNDPTYFKVNISKANVGISFLFAVLWVCVLSYPIFITYRMLQPNLTIKVWLVPAAVVLIFYAILNIFEIENSYIELSKNGISKHYRFKGIKSIEWKDVKIIGDIDYSSSFVDWFCSRPRIDSKIEHISYQASYFSRSDQLTVSNYIKEYAPHVGIGNSSLKAGEVSWWKEVCSDLFWIRPVYRTIFNSATWLVIMIHSIRGFSVKNGTIQPWEISDDPFIQWGIFYFSSMIFFHEYKRWRRTKKNGGTER